MDQPKHKPVLLREVLELLRPKPGEKYLDMTAGYGGHASAILELIGSEGHLTLVDRDQNAAEHLKKAFSKNKNVEIVKSDFLTASKSFFDQKRKFDVILADLGISSPHIDNKDRGFSFRLKGPLDMRMDEGQPMRAADIINHESEETIAQILRDYGEIDKANVLSKKIVQSRPFETTSELANFIEVNSRARSKKIHPATQVFQALRIAVNDEMNQLRRSLPIWVDLLDTGGRLGVISFHSLEDRLVKQAFKDYGGSRYDATLQTVTKKPVTASANEIVFNPRARSAKLRVAQRK